MIKIDGNVTLLRGTFDNFHPPEKDNSYDKNNSF